MKVMTSLLLALLLLRPSIPAASPGWPVDRAHSRVTFTVTRWGFVEVEGRFHDFAGTIAFDEQHPDRSRVDWRVRIDSIETGAPNRDKAVQGPEYFDAARFPEIHFSSQRVTPLGNGRFDVQGQMTIRGKTRPLTIKATYGGARSVPKEGTYAIFQTEFTIDRYDYGVVGGSVLGPAISREVRVKLIAAARS
ncbi:MAG TPA: YceI family protein [Vicinamibacterales bacterium]|nr:YceI family protein [Vicinamibacterales bacterium]